MKNKNKDIFRTVKSINAWNAKKNHHATKKVPKTRFNETCLRRKTVIFY